LRRLPRGRGHNRHRSRDGRLHLGDRPHQLSDYNQGRFSVGPLIEAVTQRSWSQPPSLARWSASFGRSPASPSRLSIDRPACVPMALRWGRRIRMLPPMARPARSAKVRRTAILTSRAGPKSPVQALAIAPGLPARTLWPRRRSGRLRRQTDQRCRSHT